MTVKSNSFLSILAFSLWLIIDIIVFKLDKVLCCLLLFALWLNRAQNTIAVNSVLSYKLATEMF